VQVQLSLKRENIKCFSHYFTNLPSILSDLYSAARLATTITVVRFDSRVTSCVRAVCASLQICGQKCIFQADGSK
jgi:hypothetical protein